jgi:hypothetical protein
VSYEGASDTPEYTRAVIALMRNTRPSYAQKHPEEATIAIEAFHRLAGEVLREPIEARLRAEGELAEAEAEYFSLNGR